jgi:hypothetical protein
VKFWEAATKAEAMSAKITFGFEKLKVKILFLVGNNLNGRKEQ